MTGNVSQYPKSFGNYLVLALKRFDDEGALNDRECPYPLHLSTAAFLKKEEGQVDVRGFQTTHAGDGLNNY